MSKTKETIQFEKYLRRYTGKQGIFGCPEVTIGWFGNERVDFLTYDTNNCFKCYEIKVTKSDFYSKCHNTFVGNYNYYVMPRELYHEVKQDIPEEIGVLVENKIGDKIYEYSPLRSIKKAIKQELKVDKDILKNSLIRSLCREAEIAHKESLKAKIKHYEMVEKNKNQEIKKLKYALYDMVNQFADEEKGKLFTMGLSALEKAFDALDIDEGIENKKLWELMQRQTEGD